MKLIVVCACLLIAAILLFVAFPPGTAYSIDKVARAWMEPAECQSGETMTAMLQAKSDLTLLLVLAIPCAFGALMAMALGGKRE